MNRVAGPQAYVLQRGLGAVPASTDDVLGEFGDRLDHLEPRLWWERRELRLCLTVPATDLWPAVREAMTAVTSTGYRVLPLDAQPASPPDNRGGATRRQSADVC